MLKRKSNSQKESKISKQLRTEDSILSSLPWDLWPCILGNLSFLELRKYCFRVCKTFRELTFQVVKEVAIRPTLIKFDWKVIISGFGMIYYSVNYGGKYTTPQHIKLQSLIFVGRNTVEDIDVFPNWMLASLTQLHIECLFARYDLPDRLLKQCTNLISLNLKCKPLPNNIPSSLESLRLESPTFYLAEAILPPLKIFHWANTDLFCQQAFTLPKTIEHGSTEAFFDIESAITTFPSSLISLKIRYLYPSNSQID